MTELTADELYDWLDDSNFRITTDYSFELINPDDGNFYRLFVSGSENPSLSIDNQPDLIGVRLEFASNELPSGGVDNYRVNELGYFQIKNIDTSLWHSILIGGSASSPTIMISTVGER